MKLDLDANDLRPLIEQVVHATLAQLGNDHYKGVDRLGYREAEAAALIGVARHVLRDARLREEIRASRVGRYVVYSRDELLRFLGENGK